jgi:hypothetical protein
MAACETYLRLALKAQSQCRATLETLAMIKNPRPLAFVKHANIAAGPQQVNNAMPVAGISRARKSKSKKLPNKLLEAQHDKRLDGRAASSPSKADSQLAVGEIDRTETLQGKTRVSRNAFKGGYRPLIRRMARALREQRRALGKF